MPLVPRRQPLDLGLELDAPRDPRDARADAATLPMALVRRVLDEARERYAPLRVVLTGGEPLAAPTFAETVTELATRDISWRVVTDGRLLPACLPALLAHPPEWVRVTLEGGSAATHDARRGHGSWRQAMLGAAACVASGLRTELLLAVHRDDRHELLAAAMLTAELGAAELRILLPTPTPASAAAGSDLAPDEWDAVAAEVPHLAAAAGVPVRLDYGARMPLAGRPRCSPLAGRGLHVTARGEVAFCGQLARLGGAAPAVGDLRLEPLALVHERHLAVVEAFEDETAARHAHGASDALDEFPCLSCARRHGKTTFLASHPAHPWGALAKLPA